MQSLQQRNLSVIGQQQHGVARIHGFTCMSSSKFRIPALQLPTVHQAGSSTLTNGGPTEQHNIMGDSIPGHCSRRVRCWGASTVQAPAVSENSDLKAIGEAYLQKFVAPLTNDILQKYKLPEEMFHMLLLTPDLDRKLKADKELQWAASTVEAVIDEAIRCAYGRSGRYSRQSLDKSSTASVTSAAVNGTLTSDSGVESDSCDNHSFPTSNKEAATWGGGMGAAAAQAAAQPGSSDLSLPVNQLLKDIGGCTNTDEDEQCTVDWGSLDWIDADTAHCAEQMNAWAADKLQQHTGQLYDTAAAHTFLQRVLYMINRLNHFWYDQLTNYTNERSPWLSSLRERVEGPWQDWEDHQLLTAHKAEGEQPWQQLSPQEIKDALVQRYHRDVAPPLSPSQQYITNDMGPLGYCHLLAVGALDGVVEASRQSRVCAGVANEVACAIFRVLMEEYGSGRLSRKHSTFYLKMMQELGLNTTPEAYLDLVPWQYLAAANHNFLLTERRRHYLRYAGALSFFEINGPSVYKTYLAAGRRCGLSADSSGYWALHIKEDERHGRQMLDEVALPLVDMYPDDAWEILWGYDQDRFMGTRAGAALVQHIKGAVELHHNVVQEQEGWLN